MNSRRRPGRLEIEPCASRLHAGHTAIGEWPRVCGYAAALPPQTRVEVMFRRLPSTVTLIVSSGVHSSMAQHGAPTAQAGKH